MPASPDITLAIHCAPVLMGQKPAALLSLPHDQCDAVQGVLLALGQGLSWAELRRGSRTACVLIYNRAMLAGVLSRPVPRASLRALGYSLGSGPDAALAQLAQRMQAPGDFPHEIGFFLGYPQRDVLGFMRHRGQRYKYAGQWKVYGDVDRAKQLFTRYRQCSIDLLAHIERTGGLVQAMARLRPEAQVS